MADLCIEDAGDIERLEVIMHYKDVFSGLLNDTSIVTDQLKSIFMANDKYSAVEKAVFIFLKKLLFDNT